MTKIVTGEKCLFVLSGGITYVEHPTDSGTRKRACINFAAARTPTHTDPIVGTQILNKPLNHDGRTDGRTIYA